MRGCLQPANVLGLQPLGALLYLELHFGTFIERPVSVRLDRREVDKYIIAAAALDKTVSLCGVEPFHNTFFSHYFSPNAKACHGRLGPKKEKATNVLVASIQLNLRVDETIF